jgi:ribonuclease PH
MPLTNIDRLKTSLGSRSIGDYLDLIEEVRNLSFAVVNGATSATNITVTGISGGKSTLVAVIAIATAVASATGVLDLSSEASITVDNTIQCATTDSTGYRLVVIWRSRV